MPTSHGAPLRLVLVLPFLGLFLLTAGLIVLVSQHQAREAARALGASFAAEIGERVDAQVRAQLAPVARVVEGNRDAFAQGLLSLDAPLDAAPRLAAQLRLFPEFTFSTLALADGRYVAAIREPGSTDPPQLAVNFIEAPLTLTGHALVAGDRPGERIRGPFAYDPRERPFMQAVLDSDVPTWTSTARYVGFDSLGLSLSAPLRDADGTLLAVTSVGISLEHLDRYLAGLELPEGGVAFLVEADGRLLSTGRVGGAVIDTGGELVRVHLGAHPHPALAALAERLPGMEGTPVGGRLVADGQTYLHALRSVRKAHGLDWVVGVVLPEAAFIEPIHRGNRRALILLGLVVLVTSAVGSWLAGRIARPIEQISATAAAGDLAALAGPSRAASRIREIGQLDHSLATMAGQLSGLIGDLERRVEQRTVDLQAANAELQRVSRLDGLTGVANRRALDEALAAEWLRAQRDQRPLALLLCDIDHFKSYNDCHGHPAGDHALREVAQALAAVVRRPGDLVARYGGEEFAVLLPHADEAGAIRVARAAREAVEALALRRDDVSDAPVVTVSIGVASLQPRDGMVPGDLLARADAQLYAAKAAGRNRVMPPGDSA